MIKKIISAIAIQSLGTVASFATVWIISNKLGMDRQGEFAVLKSWIDFLVVLGCFGLPQSVIYIINKYNVKKEFLVNAGVIYSVSLVIPFFFLSFLWGRIYSGREIEIFGFVLVSISSTLLVAHSILRGIYLTENDGVIFSLISIVPAVFLFISIYIGIFLGGVNFYISYTCASLFSFIAVLSLLLRYFFSKSECADVLYFNELFVKGFDAFLQAISVAVLPMFTYAFFSLAGINDSLIGGFNIASYLYMIFAIPFGMIAPILFNRWSKLLDECLVKTEVRYLLYFSCFVFLFMVLASGYIDYIIKYLPWGKDKIPYIATPAKILVYAAAPMLISRVMSSYFLSIGMFSVNTRLFLSKTLLSVFFMLLLYMTRHLNIVSMSYIWLLGEVFISFSFLAIYFTRVKIE
ncbi:MAG: hypothetical protein ACRC8G_04855 [Plesiomonas shigelloides]